MIARIIELLETLGYEAYIQGSFTTTEDYPQSFFTVWNTDTPIDRHYDNMPSRAVWNMVIFFYSTDPTLPESVMEQARALLKQEGWIIPSKGRSAVSDSKNHSGREINAYFIEKM